MYFLVKLCFYFFFTLEKLWLIIYPMQDKKEEYELSTACDFFFTDPLNCNLVRKIIGRVGKPAKDVNNRIFYSL